MNGGFADAASGGEFAEALRAARVAGMLVLDLGIGLTNLTAVWCVSRLPDAPAHVGRYCVTTELTEVDQGFADTIPQRRHLGARRSAAVLNWVEK